MRTVHLKSKSIHCFSNSSFKRKRTYYYGQKENSCAKISVKRQTIRWHFGKQTNLSIHVIFLSINDSLYWAIRVHCHKQNQQMFIVWIHVSSASSLNIYFWNTYKVRRCKQFWLRVRIYKTICKLIKRQTASNIFFFLNKIYFIIFSIISILLFFCIICFLSPWILHTYLQDSFSFLVVSICDLIIIIKSLQFAFYWFFFFFILIIILVLMKFLKFICFLNHCCCFIRDEREKINILKMKSYF